MTFGTFLETLKNTRYHVIGKCNICGKFTIFICTEIATARNNLLCIQCRMTSRRRHVAKVMMEYSLQGISSICDLPKNSGISIYNLDVSGSLHDVLYGHPSYVCSDYFPDVNSGTQIKERMYCQNVENLSFEDAKFDIVISEDVFEHVRDYVKGFREIYRVLKKGGYHIFTIPCYFDRKTLVRVDTTGTEDLHIYPEYHEDKIRGKMLAYRTFGIDIFEILAAIGFTTHVERSDYSDLKSGIVDSYVFVAKK